MTSGIDTLLATSACRCFMKSNSRHLITSTLTWAPTTSETSFVELFGYETVPGDNGYAMFETEVNDYLRIDGNGMRVKNIDILGNRNGIIAKLGESGSHASNCRVVNIQGEAIDLFDGSITDSYLESGGTTTGTTEMVVNLNKGIVANCIIVQRGTSSDHHGIRVSMGFDHGRCYGNLIVSTNGGGRGIDNYNGVNFTGFDAQYNTIVGFAVGVYFDELDPGTADDQAIVMRNIFVDCAIGVQNASVEGNDTVLKIYQNGFWNSTTEISTTVGSAIVDNVTFAADPLTHKDGVTATVYDVADLDPRLTSTAITFLDANVTNTVGTDDTTNFSRHIGAAGAA